MQVADYECVFDNKRALTNLLMRYGMIDFNSEGSFSYFLILFYFILFFFFLFLTRKDLHYNMRLK
jgi:hypothetical protein